MPPEPNGHVYDYNDDGAQALTDHCTRAGLHPLLLNTGNPNFYADCAAYGCIPPPDEMAPGCANLGISVQAACTVGALTGWDRMLGFQGHGPGWWVEGMDDNMGMGFPPDAGTLTGRLMMPVCGREDEACTTRVTQQPEMFHPGGDDWNGR